MEYTKDQKAFMAAVEHYLEGLNSVSTGICSGCADCQSNYDMSESELAAAYESGELADEPGFSWSSCESCGSTLGGDRFDAHALDSDNEIIHLSICVDCAMYHANGEIPETWK